MTVAVADDGRPVGEDRIEIAPVCRTVREVGRHPAASDHPAAGRRTARVIEQPLLDDGDRARLVEAGAASRRQVPVRIIEPGHDTPPGEVGDERLWSGQRANLRAVPYGEKAIAAHGKGLGGGPGLVARPHSCVHEDAYRRLRSLDREADEAREQRGRARGPGPDGRA